MCFIAKIFDRLEVEQTVHRLGVGALIRLVHGADKTDPPFGNLEGEVDVGANGNERRNRKPDIEGPPQNPGDQQQFEDRRADIKKGETEQKFNCFHPRSITRLRPPVRLLR